MKRKLEQEDPASDEKSSKQPRTQCSNCDLFEERIKRLEEAVEDIRRSTPAQEKRVCDVSVDAMQPWVGWTEIESCKICGKGPFQTTYEVSWTETGKEEPQYCSEMCHPCLKKLWARDKDAYDPEYLRSKRRALEQRNLWDASCEDLIRGDGTKAVVTQQTSESSSA